MSILEFETFLKDGVIRLPEEIASQLPQGTAVHVLITPQSPPATTPDEAWKAIVSVAQERMAKPSLTTSYTWHREDAYDHLA